MICKFSERKGVNVGREDPSWMERSHGCRLKNSGATPMKTLAVIQKSIKDGSLVVVAAAVRSDR